MTDITDPSTISNGDTPDFDVLQTYFDAIYAVINNPGQLDNNNIKASAGIAYSKLNLANSITTADLAAGAITPAKLAAPTRQLASNASTVQQGAPNTWTTAATLTIAATGTYDITAKSVLSNYGAGSIGGQAQTLVMIAKNGTEISGSRNSWRTYEQASAADPMSRTQNCYGYGVSCTAGDSITLRFQANWGGFAGVQTGAGDSFIIAELRSS